MSRHPGAQLCRHPGAQRRDPVSELHRARRASATGSRRSPGGSLQDDCGESIGGSLQDDCGESIGGSIQDDGEIVGGSIRDDLRLAA